MASATKPSILPVPLRFLGFLFPAGSDWVLVFDAHQVRTG